ncbi:unnamed protein product [Scytosiphon promiscuus]
MSSSSTSLRESWSGPMSRSKSRRSAPSNLPPATTNTPAAPITSTANSTATASTLRGKAKAAATATATATGQPPAIQRFSQYGARFNARVKKTGAGMAATARSPRSLSASGFFSAGGGLAGPGVGADTSVKSGGGGGGGGGGEDSFVSRTGGDESSLSRTGSGVRGARHAIRERNRDRKGKGSTPSSPPLGSAAGPKTLAATINDTLTVTTGRAAWERKIASESLTANGGPSAGGPSGGGGGGGGGGGNGTNAAQPEAWPWHPPETPPPACMPNLHQSSGSEGTSGSENDEGFGSGHGGVVGLAFHSFLSRRSKSSAASSARTMRSAPGGGTLGVPASSPSPCRSSNGAEGPGATPARTPARTGKTAAGASTPASAAASEASAASAASAATALSPPLPHPQVSLPPRFPRSMSSGATGASPVQPSSAPPPLASRRLSGGSGAGAAPVAAPARSPPCVLPSVFPVAARSPPRVRAASLSALKVGRAKTPRGVAENEERHHFFRDPRLETTLGLIRSGQPFCHERHIVVDFVRRAKPTTAGSGKAEVQPMDDLLRHALLLTDAALYLLEVEMLPTPPPPQSPTGPGSSTAAGSTQSPTVGEVVSAASATASATEKPKVKSIKMMDRLMPSELLRVSLPFREMTLRNGDVVAKRGCGIVLHTKVDGRVGNLWLQCRSNQDRGALVDALVSWSEASSPGKAELNVQQLAESPMAMELARLEAARSADAARPKDTDCIISRGGGGRGRVRSRTEFLCG